MQSNGGSKVGLVRKFCSRVASKVNHFLAEGYLRLVRLCLQPRLKGNALKSVAIAVLAVSSVLTMGRLPEILYPVVGSVSIDVVNLILWPLSANVEPSQPMRSVSFTGNLNVNVASMVRAASHRTDANFWPWLAPSEKSGIRFVRQDVDQFVVLDEHDANYITVTNPKRD